MHSGQDLSSGALARGGGRLYGPESRCDRNRLVRYPVHPTTRQASLTSFVFQRTPNFSVPAHNGLLAPEVAWDWKANRARHRHRDRRFSFRHPHRVKPEIGAWRGTEERQREYETRWRDGGFAMLGAFADITLNKKANETAAEFVRSKIRAVVNDPVVAEKLVPVDYPFAAKRLCVDTDYYATFNRDNVTLIDVRATPIREITCTGVRTAEAEYALDSIVCATGFDAMTGALNNIDIRGQGRSFPEATLVRRTVYISWHYDRRLSKSIYHHRPWQSFRTLQHGLVHRTTRRVD